MTDPTDNATQNRLAELQQQGYTLIPDFLSPQRLEQVNALYDTMLGSHSGRNNFEGMALGMTMPAGTCLVFAGTLLHRGGANNSEATRRAFSNQYCEPWARPQENFFLAIPPAKVAEMSSKMQSLLGYSIHPPFMGQLTASHPRKALAPGFIPPAYRE